MHEANKGKESGQLNRINNQSVTNATNENPKADKWGNNQQKQNMNER